MMEYTILVLMSAWRSWSLDKNLLPFRTRKKQSQANMEEQRGSKEKAIYTKLLRKPCNFYPSLNFFLKLSNPVPIYTAKKTLIFHHKIPQLRRSLRRSPIQAPLQSRGSSGIRPKADSKHGLPVGLNFLYKELFNRLFLTLNMACNFSMLDFINPLYQLF